MYLNKMDFFVPDRVRLRRRHLHPPAPRLQRDQELQVRMGRGLMVSHLLPDDQGPKKGDGC